MRQTAIGMLPNPDGSQPDKAMRGVFHSLSHLERTAAQVGILRNIVETAERFLYDSKSPTEGTSHDPVVQEAASSTATMAFKQLDNIIEDQARWNREDSESEAQAKELLKAETDRAKADAAFRRRLSEPYNLLRARLFRAQSGRFLALSENDAVHAYGNTAAEAVEAFNQAYFEQEHLPQPTAETPPTQEPSAPPAKKPRKRKT